MSDVINLTGSQFRRWWLILAKDVVKFYLRPRHRDIRIGMPTGGQIVITKQG